jgi:hypothetical protein
MPEYSDLLHRARELAEARDHKLFPFFVSLDLVEAKAPPLGKST